MWRGRAPRPAAPGRACGSAARNLAGNKGASSRSGSLLPSAARASTYPPHAARTPGRDSNAAACRRRAARRRGAAAAGRRRGDGDAAWRSADPERESRLHPHDAALDDGPLRCEQRLRRYEKALSVIRRAGRTGKLSHHRLEHRLLAKVRLELTHAAARSAPKYEPAKIDDLGRAPAAENGYGLVVQAFLAAAHIVHHRQTSVGEPQRDRPALLSVSRVRGGEGGDLDRQAL